MGFIDVANVFRPTVCDQCYSVVRPDDQEHHDKAVHDQDTTTVMTYTGEIVSEIRTPRRWAQPIVQVDLDKCYHPEET